MSRVTRRRQKQRRLVLVMLGAALLLALIIPGCRRIVQKEPVVVVPHDPQQNNPTPPPPPPPPAPEPVKTEPALPGVLIASIDNKAEARPQSGLDMADMVIEVIAEGGITRYMAFFYRSAAPVIGPIRSARYYFAQIAKPYNTAMAHAGGSTQALQTIADLKIPDIDEIYNSPQAFWRDKSRVAPHNLYTSTERLLAEAQRKKLKLSSFPTLPHGTMPAGNPSNTLEVTYSPYYKVTWQWQEGSYLRSVNGKLHTMKDGAKLRADNLVVMAAVHRDVVTDTLRTDIDVIGSGQARFLREGQVYSGTWKKASAHDHFEFMVDGQPFKFKEGNTWIQIVPNLNAVVTN